MGADAGHGTGLTLARGGALRLARGLDHPAARVYAACYGAAGAQRDSDATLPAGQSRG